MKSVYTLTKQETVVLGLVAQGRSNREIASELYISARTVETHLRRIFSKLGVSSRTQAALIAIGNNFQSGSKVRGIIDDRDCERRYPVA